eukprot:gene9476-10466_t
MAGWDWMVGDGQIAKPPEAAKQRRRVGQLKCTMIGRALYARSILQQARFISRVPSSSSGIGLPCGRLALAPLACQYRCFSGTSAEGATRSEPTENISADLCVAEAKASGRGRRKKVPSVKDSQAEEVEVKAAVKKKETESTKAPENTKPKRRRKDRLTIISLWRESLGGRSYHEVLRLGKLVNVPSRRKKKSVVTFSILSRMRDFSYLIKPMMEEMGLDPVDTKPMTMDQMLLLASKVRDVLEERRKEEVVQRRKELMAKKKEESEARKVKAKKNKKLEEAALRACVPVSKLDLFQTSLHDPASQVEETDNNSMPFPDPSYSEPSGQDLMEAALGTISDLKEGNWPPTHVVKPLAANFIAELSAMNNVLLLSTSLSGDDEAMKEEVVYNVICGLEGNFQHLLHLLSEAVCGLPSKKNRFIFLGDIYPPQNCSIEWERDMLRCLVALMVLRKACPEAIELIAGRNELTRRITASSQQVVSLGIPREDKNLIKGDDALSRALASCTTRILPNLPLAAVVDDKFLSYGVIGLDAAELTVAQLNETVDRKVWLGRLRANTQYRGGTRSKTMEQLDMIKQLVLGHPATASAEVRHSKQQKVTLSQFLELNEPLQSFIVTCQSSSAPALSLHNNLLLEIKSYCRSDWAEERSAANLSNEEQDERVKALDLAVIRLCNGRTEEIHFRPMEGLSPTLDK